MSFFFFSFEKVGHRMKLLRLSREISIIDMLDELNVDVSPATISNIENNKTRPSIDVVVAYANFFNVTTDYILRGIETPEPTESSNDIDKFVYTDNHIAYIEKVKQSIESSTDQINRILQNKEKVVPNELDNLLTNNTNKILHAIEVMQKFKLGFDDLNSAVVNIYNTISKNRDKLDELTKKATPEFVPNSNLTIDIEFNE